MGKPVFGAFTLLIVVNGQDITISCSVCGTVRESTVDRAEATEASARLHIASHIRQIAVGDVPPGRGGFPAPRLGG